jgi:hypothetical protein
MGVLCKEIFDEVNPVVPPWRGFILDHCLKLFASKRSQQIIENQSNTFAWETGVRLTPVY